MVDQSLIYLMTLCTNSFDHFLERYCAILLFDVSSSLHFLEGVRHDILLSNQGTLMVLLGWKKSFEKLNAQMTCTFMVISQLLGGQF